jgi:hypothetical protein
MTSLIIIYSLIIIVIHYQGNSCDFMKDNTFVFLLGHPSSFFSILVDKSDNVLIFKGFISVNFLLLLFSNNFLSLNVIFD